MGILSLIRCLQTYSFKPTGICTYSAGKWGGARAGVALRAYLGELGCLGVSATMQIPTAWKTFNNADAERPSAEKMLGQLEWMAHAMCNHRRAAGLPP